MLGDDIMDTTKSGLAHIGHAVKNTVKGALLFGAIAGAIGLGVAAFVGGGELLAGTAGIMDVAYFAAGKAASYALLPAIIGGVVTGAASLLPGSEERFGGIGKLFKRKPRAQQEQAPAQQEAMTRFEGSSQRANDDTSSMQAPAPTRTNVIYRPAPETRTETVYYETPSSRPSTIVDNSQHTHVERTDAPSTSLSYSADSSRHTARSDVNYQQTPTLPPEMSDYTKALPAELPRENPLFRPGKGAEMLQRGNERESALAK